MIRYSEHAEKRRVERSIDSRDVENVIQDPLEVIPARFGRNAACKLLEEGLFLVVVYERRDEDFIVITAVKLSKRGAMRFGFTRI